MEHVPTHGVDGWELVAYDRGDDGIEELTYERAGKRFVVLRYERTGQVVKGSALFMLRRKGAA